MFAKSERLAAFADGKLHALRRSVKKPTKSRGKTKPDFRVNMLFSSKDAFVTDPQYRHDKQPSRQE